MQGTEIRWERRLVALAWMATSRSACPAHLRPQYNLVCPNVTWKVLPHSLQMRVLSASLHASLQYNVPARVPGKDFSQRRHVCIKICYPYYSSFR